MDFRYYQLLANYPSVVICSVLVIAGTGIVISFTANEVPDFSDPQLVSQISKVSL